MIGSRENVRLKSQNSIGMLSQLKTFVAYDFFILNKTIQVKTCNFSYRQQREKFCVCFFPSETKNVYFEFPDWLKD